MPYATAADGARIYYEIAGTGEPLLLISGQAGDHHGWDAIRPDFTDRYRTIAFDHRGTGASDKPDVPYSTRGFARDAVAVLDAAGIDRAHAYGTSMGGRIRAAFLLYRIPYGVDRSRTRFPVPARTIQSGHRIAEDIS
jgi:pimeloyl-ACP methyl ester carboxylesterase